MELVGHSQVWDLQEFDLINDGAVDKNIDLSELALAYYTYNSVTDPLGGTVGDTAKYYNENSDYSYLNRGGNYQYSSKKTGSMDRRQQRIQFLTAKRTTQLNKD